MGLKDHICEYLRCACDILMPPRCLICGRALASSDQNLCVSCLAALPYTRLMGREGNSLERLFYDRRYQTGRVSACLHYVPHEPVALIARAFKYADRPAVARSFGRIMATELLATGFFVGIDFIVPVPLSAARRRKRGYNQSERLAEGVAAVTGIPLRTDLVERVADNPTQTRLSATQRHTNVEGIFQVVDEAPLAHQHVLLIDDVLTTGATLRSCAAELARAPGVRISVLTLFVARQPHAGPAL